jgi:hypothetical protein
MSVFNLAQKRSFPPLCSGKSLVMEHRLLPLHYGDLLIKIFDRILTSNPINDISNVSSGHSKILVQFQLLCFVNSEVILTKLPGILLVPYLFDVLIEVMLCLFSYDLREFWLLVEVQLCYFHYYSLNEVDEIAVWSPLETTSLHWNDFVVVVVVVEDEVLVLVLDMKTTLGHLPSRSEYHCNSSGTNLRKIHSKFPTGT